MEFDPKEMYAADRYRLMVGCITPRPIAMVGTISPGGQHNLAPYSFFVGIGAEPMTVAFCPANQPDGSEKDSLRNARCSAEGGSGVFTVGVAIEAYQDAVARAAEGLAYGVSEFSHVGLDPAPSMKIAAPRISQAPAGFECRTLQVLSFAPGVPAGANLVIGEVVQAWVDDSLFAAPLRMDAGRLKTIGRMGGKAYCRTTDTFELP